MSEGGGEKGEEEGEEEEKGEGRRGRVGEGEGRRKIRLDSEARLVAVTSFRLIVKEATSWQEQWGQTVLKLASFSVQLAIISSS